MKTKIRCFVCGNGACPGKPDPLDRHEQPCCICSSFNLEYDEYGNIVHNEFRGLVSYACKACQEIVGEVIRKVWFGKLPWELIQK